MNTVGSDLMLNLLGTGTSPTHEIIGPPNGSNVYTGNSSITNGSHNPHIGLKRDIRAERAGRDIEFDDQQRDVPVQHIGRQHDRGAGGGGGAGTGERGWWE